MDTIPAERSETEKEKIIAALEREWAAQGWPWSEERASQAHPMSPSGSGSNAGSSGDGSSSGLPPPMPIDEADSDDEDNLPRANPNAPAATRDSMRPLQPPAAPPTAGSGECRAEEAGEGEAQSDCVICLGTKDGVQALGCFHTFCRECIATHLTRQRRNNQTPSCPSCRYEVPPAEQDACGPGRELPEDVEDVEDVEEGEEGEESEDDEKSSPTWKQMMRR